jgi:2-polyprenyl-6-methoxyphenol hydroxylase-like FAD-dependent oxidoreductase
MASKSVGRVVIVGCGIAGPVLGMFLRRVGIEVVICEARPRATLDEGAFLGLAPNGMNVLTELGVHEAVEAIGIPCHGFEFQNARGERIAGIDRSDDRAQFGAELRMVRRAELHQVLVAAALARGVEVSFGRKLVGLDQGDPANVVARFADGGEERGDALIGCDGIRSMTRQLALPESPAPKYTGLVDFGGYASSAPASLETGMNVMVFGRRAFFGAFKAPSGEVWWFHNSGEKTPADLVREPSALRARILALHQDDPAWIREVVEATPTVLGPYALHDILSMPRWHVGRVCLVGDAAHAMTPSAGQGASMALEDAMVVAQCLRDVDDPGRAFAAFERARRARVEKTVAQSRRNGSGKAISGPVREWFRDRMLPFFLRLGAKQQASQYAHRIDWEQSMA